MNELALQTVGFASLDPVEYFGSLSWRLKPFLPIKLKREKGREIVDDRRRRLRLRRVSGRYSSPDKQSRGSEILSIIIIRVPVMWQDRNPGSMSVGGRHMQYV